MAGDTPRFSCLTCFTNFSNAHHLERHQLSHRNAREYECQYCRLGFNRRDALLRHWRTCEDRLKAGLQLPVLPPRKRGRKVSACIRCMRQKRKCSGLLPCLACANEHQRCSYATSSSSTETACTEREKLDPPTPGSCGNPDMASHGNDMEQALEVLLPGLQFPWADLANEDMSNLLSTSIRPAYSTRFEHCLTQMDHPTTSFSDHEKDANILPSPPTRSPPVHGFGWDIPNISPVSLSLAPNASFPRLSIRFLADFFTFHGIANSFEVGNILARRKVMNNLAKNHSAAQTRGNRQFARTEGITWHPLASKSREIVLGIQEAINSKTQHRTISVRWSSSTERSCALFFSPPNLEKFTGCFWHFWYPHWPVFHKPTFNAAQKPAQLIATMSLIGACMSPEKSERDQALSWLEAVEDWVFCNPDFSEDTIQPIYDESQLAQIENRLDSIRAVYALILIMTWEGSDKQATRARRTLFAQTVSVSRSLYFCTDLDVVYNDLDVGNLFKHWRLYALREECIRTLFYVFLLDCAFVMMNNSAPRMVISELQLSLTSPETWFHAPGADDWLQRVQKWPHLGRRVSLSKAVDLLMQTDLDIKDCEVFEHTNLLNHFALASAFFNLIFHHHHGVYRGSKSSSISRGLRNWIRLWNHCDPAEAKGSSDSKLYDDRGGVGFYRHTREYWCVAVILYSQFERGGPEVECDMGVSREQARVMRIDNSDKSQVHELILQFRDMDLRRVLVD